MNAELVTRKCALESSVAAKEKQIESLQDKVKELETQQQQIPVVQPRPSTSSQLQQDNSKQMLSSKSQSAGRQVYQRASTGQMNSRDEQSIVSPKLVEKASIVTENKDLRDEVDLSQSYQSANIQQIVQQNQNRPRSRPSDKHPVKRGNSSSSQNRTNSVKPTTIADIAKEAALLDDSEDEDGIEEYEP